MHLPLSERSSNVKCRRPMMMNYDEQCDGEQLPRNSPGVRGGPPASTLPAITSNGKRDFLFAAYHELELRKLPTPSKLRRSVPSFPGHNPPSSTCVPPPAPLYPPSLNGIRETKRDERRTFVRSAFLYFIFVPARVHAHTTHTT